MRYIMIFFLFFSLPIFAQTGPVNSKGKQFPSEMKTFKSEESGLAVTQLTTDPSDDSGLYFTQNGFIPDEHRLIFTSKRTGRWNLFSMNLDDGTFIQLTDGRSIAGTGAAVSSRTKQIFFIDSSVVKALDLKTLKENDLYKIPAGYSIGSSLTITSDGKTLAFSINERIVLATTTSKIYSDMDEKFEKKPWCAVVSGNTDGTGWHEILREKKWISHTLINPQNGNQILFCHEGNWKQVEQRLWLVASDGTGNHMVRPEETPEIQIGHEFWFNDGIHIGYQCSIPKDKNKYIGIADAGTGSFIEYPTTFKDNHVQTNPGGTLFVGDGTDNDPFINLYRLENKKLAGTHIYRHGGSFSKQEYHPHPVFTPDGNFIFFTSSKDGNGNIYMIKIKE